MIRDIRFDILKAMAICMVVFGHVVSTREISNYVGSILLVCIVGCNMPLFFVISGYFAANAIQDGQKVFKRCFKYLRAMAAYSILLAIVFYGLGVYDTVCLMLKRMITTPFFCWWFMWSLMYSMVLMWVIFWIRKRLPQNRLYSVILPIVLYVALLALPDSWYQVKYFKYCFPFFGLGVLIRRATQSSREAEESSRPRIKFLVWTASMAFYAFYIIFHKSFPCGFYWTSFNLSNILSSPVNCGAYLVRYLVALSGIIAIAYPILLLKPNRVTRALAELGTTTMGVYFLHQGILKHFIVPHYAGGGRSVMTLFSIAVILWLGCHVATWYFNQHGVLRKVFN